MSVGLCATLSILCPTAFERLKIFAPLSQYGFDASDASRGRFFFENFETLAAFGQLGGMVDMRATADFKTERFIGTVGNHFVNFDSFTVAVTELAERAFFLNRDFGWILFVRNL